MSRPTRQPRPGSAVDRVGSSSSPFAEEGPTRADTGGDPTNDSDRGAVSGSVASTPNHHLQSEGLCTLPRNAELATPGDGKLRASAAAYSHQSEGNDHDRAHRSRSSDRTVRCRRVRRLDSARALAALLAVRSTRRQVFDSTEVGAFRYAFPGRPRLCAARIHVACTILANHTDFDEDAAG